MSPARPPRAFAALLFTLGACGAPAPEPPTRGVDSASPTTWASPEAATEVRLATLPAEVVAAPEGRVHAAAPLSGRLLRWRTAPGARVGRGAPLADLDSPDLAALSAEVEAARKLVEAAEQRRASGLGAEAEVASARAALAGPEARLARLRTAVDRGATWTSPVDAVVVSLSCAPGDEVGPSVSCAVLQTDAAALLRTHLPERRLAAIDAAGDALTADWTGADGREAAALALVRLAPALDPATRTVEAWFLAPSATRVGQSGRVGLRVPAPPDALVVPRASLSTLDGHAVVFADEAAPRAVPVTPLGADPTPGADGVVVVPAAPLAPAERVATRGVAHLKFSLTAAADEEAP
jgi:hypothetical protein